MKKSESRRSGAVCVLCILAAVSVLRVPAASLEESLYQVGKLKPVDSELQVKVGDVAPDFIIPGVDGKAITLSDYRGRKNVALSFVPAAWTPVCSSQWPGYDIAQDVFDEYDTVILGITVDNAATLHAWRKAMGGLWFPVLSDFWPHGAVARQYGVMRSDGTTERALFLIDKKGIVRYIDVHDINVRPDLGVLADEMAKLK